MFSNLRRSLAVLPPAVLLLDAGLASTVIQKSDNMIKRRDTVDCTPYEVQHGDTCYSIGLATNTTYAQLRSWNSEIDIICSNLANLTDSDICISNPYGNYAIPSVTTATATMVTTAAAIPSPTAVGSSSYCGEYHLVVSGEDCGTIEESYGIDLEDFIFLNPELWDNCTNLEAEYYYCVEAVGAISTYSGYAPTATTSAFNQTACTTLPNIGNPLANFTSNEPSIPLANGTRVDCYSYIWFNDTSSSNAAADCWSLAQVYGASGQDLVLWNPSLEDTQNASTTIFAYPCTLSASSSYCVALASSTAAAAPTTTTPSPRAAGEIANCTNWFAPQSYNTCQDILLLYYLTIEEFYAMNPSVGSTCTGMSASTYYCVSTDPGGIPPSTTDDDSSTGTTTGVSTPSPVQTGIASNCDLFYLVVSEDGCEAIATKYNITLADFYAWNPAVKTDCSGLDANDYVCVGIDASSSATGSSTTTPSTTTSTSTTGTATGIVTPTPTQIGMTTDCDAFYYVVPNDGCYDIAAEYGIALADFYTWNPAVGDDCSGLEPNVYVCVGISTSTQVISTNGLCGGDSEATCAGSAFGDCCSSGGYCGSTAAYCGGGCQTEFGNCTAGNISIDGTCGGDAGLTCAGSAFGDCCSSSDYCGSTSDYCGSGCQADFGTCTS